MEFKGYTKFRIPQATVCSEQSTHIGGLQPGAQASVKAGAQSGYQGFPDSSVGKESTCNAGDPSSTPRLGRYTGEGIGNPLQCPWASLVVQLVNNLPAMQETCPSCSESERWQPEKESTHHGWL